MCGDHTIAAIHYFWRPPPSPPTLKHHCTFAFRTAAFSLGHRVVDTRLTFKWDEVVFDIGTLLMQAAAAGEIQCQGYRL